MELSTTADDMYWNSDLDRISIAVREGYVSVTNENKAVVVVILSFSRKKTNYLYNI